MTGKTNLHSMLIAGTALALLGVSLILPANQVQASSNYPSTKYTNGKYGVETDASVRAKIAWHRKREGKWWNPWFDTSYSKSNINRLKDSRQKIVYQAVAGNKILFSVSEVYQKGQAINEYYYVTQRIPSKWHDFRLVTIKDIKLPVNWNNKKGITYVKVRYTTKKKGAIAKIKTLKSSEPFPNDPYPKTKYSNGNYGVETDASVDAKVGWYKRHFGKSSTDRYNMFMTLGGCEINGFAMRRKSRQKIVYVATKGMTNKVLFKVTDVQEGRIGDYIHEEYRYFDQQKMPTVYGKYYFWEIGPQAVPVNWWNKKGVVYCKCSYYTKSQLKKMYAPHQKKHVRTRHTKKTKYSYSTQIKKITRTIKM